jgi:DNA modification methylase
MKNKVIIGDCELYLGDCMDILPTLGKVDAVITDPPYGIGAYKGGTMGSGVLAKQSTYDKVQWDDKPIDDDCISKILAAADVCILFGGNYFHLPPARCWLIWDKDNGANAFADAEMAWTNIDGAVRLKRHKWQGMLQENMAQKEDRVHPTQKPTPIMCWAIQQAPKAETILDPFMGSGTTGVAAVQMGRKFIGIEREPKYFEIACKRIEAAYAQGQLFAPEIKKQVQENLI